MPSCKKCGAYTKYSRGLCRNCYYGRTSKAGKVYLAKVRFASGKSKIYVGQTKRSVYKRIGEHQTYQDYGKTNHYTGRGISIEPIGSIFSNNRFKAERTIKRLPRESKIKLARKGARNFWRRVFS